MACGGDDFHKIVFVKICKRTTTEIIWVEKKERQMDRFYGPEGGASGEPGTAD